MKSVYREAATLSNRGEEFVIATVVHTKGSTPQKPGAALLVRSDGSTVGTLGGGCVEGDIWFAAKEALRERSLPFYKEYYLNEDIAARDGLVCGGSMFFAIDPVIDPAGHSKTDQAIADAYDGGPSVALVSLVKSSRLQVGATILVRENGDCEGTLGDASLDKKSIAAATAVMPMGRSKRITTAHGDEVFVEGYTSPALIVLVGGGHVNLQVARVAEIAGFRVMVTDDRQEYADAERFSMAEAVRVSAYSDGLDDFPITPNTAIVVGSRGHHFDDQALEAALNTRAGYVGLLGSKRKTILIYEALLKRGVARERLESVRSPIGLDLGGRTPEEIAISIVSEIIAFRNDKSGSPMKIETSQIDRIVNKLSRKTGR